MPMPYFHILIQLILFICISCSGPTTRPRRKIYSQNPLSLKYKNMRQKNWNRYLGIHHPPVQTVPAKKTFPKEKRLPHQKQMILLDQSVSMMCFKKRFNKRKCARLKTKSLQSCHYKKLIQQPKLYQRCIRKQALSIN